MNVRSTACKPGTGLQPVLKCRRKRSELVHNCLQRANQRPRVGPLFCYPEGRIVTPGQQLSHLTGKGESSTLLLRASRLKTVSCSTRRHAFRSKRASRLPTGTG